MNDRTLKMLREENPKGTRVEVLELVDLQSPRIGTKGTVFLVDDIGLIHVS